MFFSGNGFSFNGQPAVAYAAVPAGLTGAPRVQDFASTAGTLNLCGPISQTLSVIPKAERFGALLAGDLVLSESVTVFGELLYSHTTQSAFISPLTLFGIPGFQLFTVGPSNPYNPFGTRVGIGYAFADTRSGAKVDTDFVRPLLGAKGTLGGDWTWELSVLQSQDYSHDAEIGAISNSATIQAALDSPNPGTALNPFGVGAPGSQSLLQTLFGDGLIKYRSRSQAVAGFARGPTFDLPAGAIEVVVGGEFSHDRLYSNFVSYPGHSLNEERTNTRHTAALFGEARVPILSGEPKGPPGGAVALTVAGRYDNYSDFGSSSNPQLGIEWRPLDTVLVRGTFAKAFKAPALDELYRPQTRSATVLVDPHVGHSVVVPVLSGGNPALEPMGGRSDTIGGIYSSRAIRGLEASVTLWRVKETNVIQTLTPQFVLNNESSFPERVIRDASGNLTSVDNSRVNFGAIDVAGLDYLVNYKYRTNLGDWSPSVAATQTYRYQTRLVAGAPARDRVSKADVGGWAPRLKGTVALGWNFGPYTVNIDGRFVSRYQDYGTRREIGNFWLFDANFRYMIGKALGIAHPLLKGTYVELGAVNIANTLPQYSNFNRFLGYDPTQADIRGRFLYLQLGMKL